jgi:hypothetical protein
MKLPDTVKIGPIVYRIREVERLQSSSDGTSLWGDLVCSDGEILIEASIHNQQKRQTLLHEIVHAVLLTLGRREEANDEGLVEALAYGINGVIVDNPSLITLMSGEGDDA